MLLNQVLAHHLVLHRQAVPQPLVLRQALVGLPVAHQVQAVVHHLALVAVLLPLVPVLYPAHPQLVQLSLFNRLKLLFGMLNQSKKWRKQPLIRQVMM